MSRQESYMQIFTSEDDLNEWLEQSKMKVVMVDKEQGLILVDDKKYNQLVILHVEYHYDENNQFKHISTQVDEYPGAMYTTSKPCEVCKDLEEIKNKAQKLAEIFNINRPL